MSPSLTDHKVCRSSKNMSISRKKTQKRANKNRGMDLGIPRDSKYTSFQAQPPVSQRMRTVLRYSETVQRTGLPLYDYVWRLNSLFDPNLTGGGHQPKGFDQLAAFYQRYRVYKVRWEVNVWASNSAIASHLVVVPTNASTTYADAADAIEATFAKHTICYLYQPRRLTGVVDLAMLNGKTHVAYASDDTTQALVSANPTETLDLHVFSEALDGSTTLVLYYTVTLQYDVEFSDPVQLGQS